MNHRTVEVFNQVFTTGSVSKVTGELEAIASNLLIMVTSYPKFYGNGHLAIVEVTITNFKNLAMDIDG